MSPEQAHESLKSHSDAAYRMACRITNGNETLARDLVQDAFIKILKKPQDIEPKSFKGWLYRVMQNLHIDYLRKHSREAAWSYEEDIWPALEPLPLEQLERGELVRMVQGALAQIPEDFRRPIILCDLEGLPYEEIARQTACPVGTVRSRIHRGRRELRTLLKRLLPITVAAATALGAYMLSKIQQSNFQTPPLSITHSVSKPTPQTAKGESRHHEKS